MLIVGFQMVTINFFTSIGMPKKSIFLSLTRQVLYLIPLILLLPHFFKNNPLLGVWWSIPISDILSAFTAFFMLLKQKLFFNQEIAIQAQNSIA
jgi:Na+-driven multidrug efflux pump